MENKIQKMEVEETAGEAMISKLSAIQKGYFTDNFSKYFVKKIAKKDVIINRGYWSRVQTLDQVILDFLTTDPNSEKQIISLGCGLDTTFFRFSEKGLLEKTKFCEIDLPYIINVIQNTEGLKKYLKEEEVKEEELFLKSKNYCLSVANLADIESVKAAFAKFSLNFKIPTFIFAECVLVYIKNSYVEILFKYLSDNFANSFFMFYEMFNPKDQMGKVMVENFEAKGCPLLGIFDYPTLDSQRKRLENYFTEIEIYDMITIYNKYLDKTEKSRVEKLEFLDELEEWVLIQQHYFFCLCKKFENSFKNFFDSVKIAKS